MARKRKARVWKAWAALYPPGKSGKTFVNALGEDAVGVRALAVYRTKAECDARLGGWLVMTRVEIREVARATGKAGGA